MLPVRQKIFIARSLNYLLRIGRALVGRGMKAVCRRRGLVWELDLNEGIDLSIYLLGAYEPRPIKYYTPLIRPGDTVFDIGANIGAHTLHFARLVGASGRVVAFEPTEFGVAKLRRNLSLNPELAGRVTVEQRFVVADSGDPVPAVVPASWPVGEWNDDLHWGHLGKSKTLNEATAVTGDAYCAAAGITAIRFVKIDVDGHEFGVLKGLRKSLREFRPRILIEIAPFIYEGINVAEFDEFVRFLADLNYTFFDANTGWRISNDPTVLRRTITPGGGINALLCPTEALA